MKKLSTMAIMVIALFALSSCSLLDKLRGGVSPHADYVVETPTTVEDVRG